MGQHRAGGALGDHQQHPPGHQHLAWAEGNEGRARLPGEEKTEVPSGCHARQRMVRAKNRDMRKFWFIREI